MSGGSGSGPLRIDGGVILSRTAGCPPVYDDPMRTAAQLLAEIRADGGLEEFCAAQGIDLLVVFGSAVSSPETARDVDLAYLSSRAGDHLSVTNALLDRFGDGLDVMSLATAGPVAKWEALGGGRILVERVPDLFATRQMAAFGEVEDTREFRELALAVMRS